MIGKEKRKRENAVPTVMQELLRVLPGASLTEKHYNEMLAGRHEVLATPAEGIRRELLPIAILTSNHTNEARKHHARLERLASYLINLPLDRPGQLELTMPLGAATPRLGKRGKCFSKHMRLDNGKDSKSFLREALLEVCSL